jgi:hypothetical protein
MSTEEKIKAECRVYALGWAVSVLFASQFRQMGDAGPAMLERARQQALEGARLQTFPNFDPAMSDLLSAELESAVDRILGMAKEFLAKGSSGKSWQKCGTIDVKALMAEDEEFLRVLNHDDSGALVGIAPRSAPMKRPVRDAAAAFAAESPRIFIDARVTPATADCRAPRADREKHWRRLPCRVKAITFSEPGTYFYICTPWMYGQVIVE